ncbi:phosphotransferase [Lentzea kristufekii]|uniref:phosphotransferase n=1 Tax=Lentzea kristufekii TaxID=3095430 RepID=UPI003873BF91
MRLGENALFHLPDSSAVVRIARSRDHWDDAVKEVAVASWLHESGLPAARLYDLDQPISVSGYPVTFWRYIDGRNGGRGDVGALGRLLLKLHKTPRPTTFELPEQDILARVQPRIGSAGVPDADKRFLLNRVAELREEINALSSTVTARRRPKSPPRPVSAAQGMFPDKSTRSSGRPSRAEPRCGFTERRRSPDRGRRRSSLRAGAVTPRPSPCRSPRSPCRWARGPRTSA